MDNIVMIPIDKITPYEKNPRKHEETVNKLVNLIPKVGFNQPLLLDKNYVIVKGHARYEAALKLGMNELPCIITTNSEELNRFDRIADNKVHEFSTWDKEELMHEVDMIDTDFDLTSLGIEFPSEIDFTAFQGGFNFDDADGSDSQYDEAAAEERQQKFLEYLKAKTEQQEAPVITTQQEIDAAEEKVMNAAKPGAELVKIECSKCGGTYYIKKGVYCQL